jgi:HD superfamily phosphohydrolase
MERVETLLKKLQDQFAQNASPDQMLLTVQMLQAELLHLQHSNAPEDESVVVTVSSMNVAPKESAAIATTPPAEERIVETLQVDEAEIEAELEEIKRNAETLQQISVQNKPHIIFEPEEDIPTLTHQHEFKPLPEKEELAKEINETVSNNHASINEKLKQSKIDLGDTLTEVPIRDLRKAIGVNDRFLFINELFRGDEVAYERSIKTINSFSIFAEAEYWIQRELKVKNGWDSSNEMVAQFFQLVKRRFS